MLFVSTHPAMADGRTVAFVKGMAYGISAHCPNLPVDKSEVSRTKHIPGIRDGDVNEFISGMSYTSELLKTHSDACYSDDNSGCSCENICSLRPGTCYFVKEQAK